MNNLPRVPKDWQEIAKLCDKLSYWDLRLLNNMDEYSRECFFERAKQDIQNRKESSKKERARGVKFFFTVVAICTLAAVTLLNDPTNTLSVLFRLFSALALISIAGNFIAIPIKAMKSAIDESVFRFKEYLLSDNPMMDGVVLVSLFIFVLNDLF